jgi:hypothetical protein
LAAPADHIDHVGRAADQRASTIYHHIHHRRHVSNACCDGGGRDGCNEDPPATLGQSVSRSMIVAFAVLRAS